MNILHFIFVSTFVAWNAQCIVTSPFFFSAKIYTPIIRVTFFWACFCTISKGKIVSTAHFVRNLELLFVKKYRLFSIGNMRLYIFHRINSDLEKRTYRPCFERTPMKIEYPIVVSGVFLFVSTLSIILNKVLIWTGRCCKVYFV